MPPPALTGQSVAALRARIVALEALHTTRHEPVTGTVAGSAGQATLTFSPAFAAPPRVIGEVTVANNQIVIAVVGAVTKTGVTVTAYRARGTLLLSAGPFELAPAGTLVRITAIGR